MVGYRTVEAMGCSDDGVLASREEGMDRSQVDGVWDSHFEG